MGGGKGSSPKAPPPIDPGKSMGEYLFGKDFSGQYQGITDPRLQDRLISSEGRYRPQYTVRKEGGRVKAVEVYVEVQKELTQL